MQKAKAPAGELSGTQLWLVLIKAYHALLAFTAKTLRGSGLGDSDFRVLEALLHKGPLAVHEISAKVFLTPGSVSVAIDRLLAKELVLRAASDEDRRVKIVSLTPVGRKLIERVFREHARRMDALLAEVPAKDRRRLAETMKAVGKKAAGVE